MGDGSTSAVASLIEDEDYYLDKGLLVLTAHYHLRRGCCCEQGCRHCPYKELEKSNNDSENTETKR